MEAHAACAAWTNKALCVLEWILPPPYYQFEVRFAGDDINDKQSTLVSSSGMETAALNLNNFSIHSLWDVHTGREVSCNVYGAELLVWNRNINSWEAGINNLTK